jgi:hypothetical protein
VLADAEDEGGVAPIRALLELRGTQLQRAEKPRQARRGPVIGMLGSGGYFLCGPPNIDIGKSERPYPPSQLHGATHQLE